MSQDALGLLKHLKTARARWSFPDEAACFPDFHHLSDNVPLAACKFPIRALEAFLFRPMAGNEDDECFQGRN